MADFLAHLITNILIAFALVMLVGGIGYAAGFASAARSSPGRFVLRIVIAATLAIGGIVAAVHFLAPGQLPPYLVIGAVGASAGYKGYKKTAGAFK